ncbi:Phosphoserine aminotransferase [Rhizoctonia solani]|uniref:phosphoserine transaminase n=1 Tax=Rhizoctonia solani TaxID=456999 RepID=A0A8H7IK74_9AGAM|nr:Phosphoserine aminotransferase [Rhizoctonia solani]
MPERDEVVNVTAGPSQLPLSVLEEAAKGLINFNGTGIGITEISHRSSEFIRLNEELESTVRETLGVPDTHVILFAQGGATTQFAAIPINLLAWKVLKTKRSPSEWTMDYIVTGSWSAKAAEEAERLAYGAKVNIAADSRHHSAGNFDNIPHHKGWKLSPPENSLFVYYCENETVDGNQFSDEADSPAAFPFNLVPSDVPIVADFSSSFMSRPIPKISRYGIIYAGVQKNLGPAGLTIVIVRKDLLADPVEAQKEGAPPIPTMLSYHVASQGEHLKATGGLEKLREINKQKQAKLYGVLQQAEKAGKVHIRVQEASRSWMNVTFDNFKSEEDAKFVEAANKQRIVGVKGHRSVGGIRISLYNAVTLEQVDKIVAFIKQYYAL